MERFKGILPFIGLLLLSVSIIVILYPRIHPLGGLRLPFDDEESIAQSRRTLDSLSVDVGGLIPSTTFRYNRFLLRQLHETFGIDSTNGLLQSFPVVSWQIRWKKDEGLTTRLSDSEDREAVMTALMGEVSLSLSTTGGIVSLERNVPDSAVIPAVTLEEARMLARDVLGRFGALKEFTGLERPVSEKTIVQPHRSDYEFIWEAALPGLPNQVQVKTLITGNSIGRIDTDLKIPEDFTKSDLETALGILIVIVFVAVIGTMIVFAFRRFRSFEIGFRLATVMGVLAAAVTGAEIFLSTKESLDWAILVGLLLGPLFVGGALVLVWAVSESVGREVWKEKFVSLDLIANGYLFHSRIGGSIIKGFALGATAMAFWLILVEGLGNVVNLRWMLSGESVRHEFDVALPWVYVVGHGFYTSAYFFSLFILFGMSFLRRWIRSDLLLVVISAVLLSLVRQGDILPFGVGFAAETLLACIFVWAFYRFDALTGYLTLLTFVIIREGGLLFVSGHPTYEASGMGMLAFFGIMALGSVAVQFRKGEITDFDVITPVFAKHITERQRLQQELEIARQVQMSFLPKENPRVPGLDIASRCVPALEVGGDYYDFVRHGPGSLAVVVGDVSGKGTQAAFYMTLAKGFVRALSDPRGAVSTVLTQMNKLFYDNVERGAFISMVYGVFDTRTRILRVTRAGHNPVLVWRAKTKSIEVIQPNGLALGLEDGKKFSKTIEEVRIRFRPGDCFLFYTDGFTEAMNKQQQEYGDERFVESVKAHAEKKSTDIVEGLFRDVRQFMGKAQQHDDMTIVVVKAV